MNHQSLRNPNMTTGSVNSAGQVRVKTAWETYFKRQNIYHLQSIVDLVKHSRDGSFSFPEADIVTGGFPCQDFSVSGKRRGFKSDRTHLNVSSQESLPSTETRGMLYYWMREVINIVKPKIFIAENVKGLVSLGGVKEIIAKDFRSVEPGYHVLEPQVLHAGNYGVPQNRERVFFIGVRQDVMDAISVSGAIAYPDPSHNVATGDIVTGYDYIKDLAEPEAATDRSQRAYSKAKWYGKHCQGQTEIKTDGLAPTIRSEHHGNIEFRRLSQDNGGKIKHEFHLPQHELPHPMQ